MEYLMLLNLSYHTTLLILQHNYNTILVMIVVIICCFLLLLFFGLKSNVSKSRKSKSSYSHIPGPKPLPLIGNLHLMLRGRNPHRLFKDLAAKYGPLMHLRLGQTNFIIVSSLDFAKQVLATHDVVFANRPPGIMPETLGYNYSDIAFAPYGGHWRHLRKICKIDIFSAARVQYLRPVREAANTLLAESIASCEGSTIDLSEMIFTSSFDIIARATFGAKTKERAARITSVITEITKSATGFIMVDLFPSSKLLPLITGASFKFRQLRSKLDGIFDALIDEHRAAAAASHDHDHDDDATFEDFTDVLLKIQKDETHQLPLDTNSIKGVLQNIFTAGTITTGTIIEWAMSELIKNPSKLNKVQEELRNVFDGEGRIDEDKFEKLKYLKLVIKETLRMHPPGPLLLPRMNSERCEINGYEIPANTRVLVNAWALGRDPEYWRDAEKFIPERFAEEKSSVDFRGNNLEYMPFGAGRRMCPGMSLGIANVELMLVVLLYHFDWEMADGIKNEDLDMSEALNTTVNRKNHLHVIPIVKRPLHALVV